MSFCLLFGGKSFEHEISIVSAITLKKLLDIESFIFLDTEHCFYLIPKENLEAKFFSKGLYAKAERVYPKKNGFYRKTFLGEKALPTSVILNLIHGGDGEDGMVACLLDFYGIPYIGARNEACVVSYDKEFTKLFAKSRGVASLEYNVVYRGGEIPKHLHYPFILKPARLGSSLGISVVEREEELEYALDSAFEFDSKVIIEPFIAGVKEYNLAGYKDERGMQFSFIEEPQKNKILDFEKKYLDFSRTSNAKEAEISDCLKQELQELFTKLYMNAFEGALIRCDFFVIEGKCYLNEINPIPGSLANYLFEDFKGALESLSKALPSPNTLKMDYALLHKIQFIKGK